MAAASIVIAEKPSQARMYSKHIGTSYGQVFAARGHLFELLDPEKLNPEWATWSDTLLRPESGWYPSALKDEADIRKRYADIKAGAKKASRIYLATDPDREGEGIAQDILSQLKKDIGFSGEVVRVLPLGEDAKSVKAAFEGARPIEEFDLLYLAYKARAQSDHIFNLSLTRAATTRLSSGGVVSIGRVVTPTLGIVCSREVAIAEFVPVDFFVPTVTVEGNAGRALLKLPSGEEDRILDRSVADELVRAASSYAGPLKVVTTAKKQAPPRLFSMSTLQVTASKRWKWGAKKTADVLQELYSKYQVTTYPRSAEVSLPEAEIDNVPAMMAGVQQIFGNVGFEPVIRKKKGYFSDKDLKGASHFAIVPNINTVDKWAAAVERMSGDEKKLFELIARRYLGALGPDREYDSTTLSISVNEATFKVSGSVETKPGWREAWGKGSNPSDDEDDEGGALPPFQDGDPVRAVETSIEDQKTKPPARLAEGSLIELMIQSWKLVDDDVEAQRLKEAKGIGTEATRNGIVQNLLNRGFIKTESGKLHATDVGMKLYRVLQTHAPNLLDVAQTARMEMLLDQVQKGEVKATETVEQIIGQAVAAIDGIRRASANGPHLNMRAARKPTANMLKAARAKAKRAGARLPKGVADSFEKCSEFLGPRPKANADGSYPPSEGQVSFARKIAEAAGAEIPAEALNDRSAMKKWIDANKGSLPKKGGGGTGKPSPKQISFAEKIAKKKGIAVPSECLLDKGKISAWIDENK